jgi:hypothetical protein
MADFRDRQLGRIKATEKLGNASKIPSSVYQNIYIGRVVDIEDPLDEGRIKVSIDALDQQSDTEETKKKKNKTNRGKRVQGEPNNPKNSTISNYGGTTGNVSFPIDAPKKTVNSEPVNNQGGSDIPWCVPLFPKHLQIMPKVGEYCTVMLFRGDRSQLNRAWIAPMVSSKKNLSYNDSTTGADNLNTAAAPSSSKNITKSVELLKRGDFTGGFPEKLDISLMSRNNADIVLPTKEDRNGRLNSGGEVLIRAGKFSFEGGNDNLSLNKKNPGYLRLKVVNENETYSMLYSDYISLVSYKNSDGSSDSAKVFNINPLLEKDLDITNFQQALSPLVRGDRLISFLNLIKDYVKKHNHPYHQKPATNANSKEEIEKFDLNSIISPNIRIN